MFTDFDKFNRGRSGRMRRVLAAVCNRGFNAVLLYRIANLSTNRMPFVSYILCRLSQLLYAVDIAPTAVLGPGVVLVHCFGTVVGSQTQISGDCVIFHGVTFGDRGSEWVGSNQPDGHPIVGSGCIFGAGCKVLGNIQIGDNCVIGANSVVLNHIPANSVVAGIPARIISRRPLMNDDLRPIDGYRIDSPKTSLLLDKDEIHE